MKALVCTVGGVAAAVPGDNDRRLRALEALLDRAKPLHADLAVMPGGYFASSGKPEHAQGFAKIKATVEARGIAVCFGVDTRKKYPGDHDLAVRLGKLSWFGFAWTQAERWQGPWRQRSMTSRDQREIPVTLAAE